MHMLWQYLFQYALLSHLHAFLIGEFIELRQHVLAVGHLCARHSQLVEEAVRQCRQWLNSLGRIVRQEHVDEVAGEWVSLVAEDLGPLLSFDLRKLERRVRRIHGVNLLASRCAQHLDDLNQLVDAAVAREQRLAKHELTHHTTDGPHVDRVRVSA